jgi:hypothetical protein
MKLGVKTKEKIARTIGEYFSTNDIVNIFADANISTDKSLYAKWRIILDAFSKVTTENGILCILEEFCHPLGFADLQVRQNFIDALNMILYYEDIVIRSTDRTAKVVSVSESKKEVKEEEIKKVKVLPDINKSSYSEKVIDLMAKEFCEVIPNWEIKKIIKPIIQKNNELYNQEEIKEYFDEIDIGDYPFYTFSEALQAVRRKYEKADLMISTIITKLLHPLNYNADENQAENIAKKINKYLKYDRKVVDWLDKEKGEYAVCGIANLEDEEYFRTEEEIALFEEEQEELQFLRFPENKEKISTLRKAYQTFINIVEVFCENPSKPSNEMNDMYLKTKKLIADAVRDLRLYVNNGDSTRIHTLEHYFIPFNNLFTAEREYTPDVMEIDLSGKKLNWDYIRPKMNATYGCINDLYYKIDGSDMPSKPDVQQILDGVSSLLSRIKSDNKKVSDKKHKINISAKSILPKPLEIKIVGGVEVGGLQDGLKSLAQSKKDNKNRFPHKLPAGTNWNNITIKFEDDDNVYIQVKQFKVNSNYKEMGFVGGGKNPKPSEAWTFLRVLAKVNGELTIKNSEAKDKYKKQKELLAKSLQSYFSLDYDPFYPYKSSVEKQGDSYKIKMTLIPSLIDNKKPDIIEENNDSDIREYYETQTPQINEE